MFRHLLPALGALVAVLCLASAGRTAVLPATPATLYTVLKAAQPGDVAQLAAGTYGPVDLYAVVKAAPGVVVEAAAAAAVTIGGINLNASDGFTFRRGGGTLTVTPYARTGFAIYFGGARSRFEGLTIKGDCATFRTAGQNGIMVRNATGGAIVGNELSCLNTGINHLNPLNAGDVIRIEGNRLHDLRSDGIRGQSSNILIKGNQGWDFYPAPEDHPDFIQVFTTGTTAPLRNMTFEGNGWRKGRGAPVQGLFIGNEARLPFEGLVVRGNVVAGGMWHGISISWAKAPVVEGNYAVGAADSLAVDGQVMRPWLQVIDSTDAVVRGNTATAFRFDRSTFRVQDGNVSVANAAAGDYAAADAWAGGAVAESAPDPRDTKIAALLIERAKALELAKLARAARAKNQYLDPLVALLSAQAP